MVCWSDTLESCCQTLTSTPCCCLFSGEIHATYLNKKGVGFISSLFFISLKTMLLSTKKIKPRKRWLKLAFGCCDHEGMWPGAASSRAVTTAGSSIPLAVLLPTLRVLCFPACDTSLLAPASARSGPLEAPSRPLGGFFSGQSCYIFAAYIHWERIWPMD